MARLGLASLFPMDEIGYHGILPIIANAPRILKRMREAARLVVEADPDVLVIIDCPGFNLGVARRVRKARPSIAIVDYVSPTVWVWRPDRARWMSHFVDQVLAILPFEPEVHVKLGGPPCTYVGHPLIERLDRLRPAPGERPPLGAERPLFLVLPGSRRGEVKRLMKVFGETTRADRRRHGDRSRSRCRSCRGSPPRSGQRAESWPVQPTIVEGEAAKLAAFRRAHVALAAIGHGDARTGALRRADGRRLPRRSPGQAVQVRAIPDSIRSFSPTWSRGGNEIPEFLDGETTPERMAAALLPLFADTPERRVQVEAFGRLDALMAIEAGTPSSRAADVVLATAVGRGKNPAG